jgi:hypothetical protein
MDGWVKIYRSILTWEWYSDINVRVLFIHLLLKANHAPNRWQGIEIQAGQLVTSLSRLEQETGLSQKKIRNALKKLEKTGELGTQKGRAYTLITICNYARYQGDTVEEGTPKGTQRAHEGHTRGTQRATNKNDKNDKNDKKNIPVAFSNEQAKKLNDWAAPFFHEKYLGQKSLEVFDKLTRIDGYQPEQIQKAIEWARADDFWSSNFLSPVKLRNKDKNGVKYIDVFLAKLLKNGTNRKYSQEGASWDELAEIVRKHSADLPSGC